MMPVMRISCPSCGGNQFDHDEAGNLICSFCGARYASPGEEIICPACGTKNPPDARRCMECGLVLGKLCPVCNHMNPAGADYCLECAAPLDTLETIYARLRERQTGSTVRAERMTAAKHLDQIYMEAQHERLQAEERERLARLAEQRARAIRQQRRLMTLTVAAGLIIFAGVMMLIAFLMLR